jgi:hypothetical protein
MNQVQNQSSDKVTVLVFKDHLAARTFHIPTQWIAKLGILLSFLLFLSIVTSIFAVRYYRIASKSELTNLRPPALNSANSPSVGSQKNKEVVTDSNSSIDQFETQPPSPSSPDEANLNKKKTTQPLMANLFTGLQSANAETPAPDPSSLPFSIQNTRFSWQEHNLQVKFALHYTKSDKGSQQGRIVVLARGPSTLLVFPKETLNPAGISPLFNYKNGEYFSVSHFREGAANFGPITPKSLIQEIEILILSRTGELILNQSFPLKESSSEPQTTTSKPQDDS